MMMTMMMILALEMASSGNQHCANSIGTLLFQLAAAVSQNQVTRYTVLVRG